MQQPEYQIGQLVIITQGSGAKMGTIVGASLEDGVWRYDVSTGANTDEISYAIEEEIVFVAYDKGWSATDSTPDGSDSSDRVRF